MKADDSRRISLLAERLLSEFEQTRVPSNKAVAPKILVEIEPETAVVTDESLAVSPKMTVENETQAEVGPRISQANVEKANAPVERPLTAPELVFDFSFWAKWIGIAIMAIVYSISLYYYYRAINDSGDALRILFGVATGLTSLVQWYLFRDRLELWWVAVNAVTGIGLGSLQKYLFETTGWGTEDLRILLAIWIVVNFVLGLILLRRIQEKSRDLSSIEETGTRQSIFLVLLSVSLVLGAISNVILVLGLYDLLNVSWILYGIAAVLTGIVIILIKEVPRNFGFIALAIFLLFDGVNVERLAFNSEYPLYYFTLSGIMALVSGVFWGFQRETWKNFGFIMLSGCLVMTGLAGLSVYNATVNHAFLVISSIFAVPAVVFFFLRK
jgi:hypothetical protein